METRNYTNANTYVNDINNTTNDTNECYLVVRCSGARHLAPIGESSSSSSSRYLLLQVAVVESFIGVCFPLLWSEAHAQ